jgi:hypothetical protein
VHQAGDSQPLRRPADFKSLIARRAAARACAGLSARRVPARRAAGPGGWAARRRGLAALRPGFPLRRRGAASSSLFSARVSCLMASCATVLQGPASTDAITGCAPSHSLMSESRVHDWMRRRPGGRSVLLVISEDPSIAGDRAAQRAGSLESLGAGRIQHAVPRNPIQGGRGKDSDNLNLSFISCVRWLACCVQLSDDTAQHDVACMLCSFPVSNSPIQWHGMADNGYVQKHASFNVTARPVAQVRWTGTGGNVLLPD